MFVDKAIIKFLAVIAAAFFLAGCSSYSGAALESKKQSTETEIPDWLQLSHRFDSTTRLDDNPDVYQMDEGEVTNEMNDENNDTDIIESDSPEPSTSSGESAGTSQSEQEASIPTVPQHSVGSTWYDLQTSGKSSPESSGGFYYDLEIVTDD